MRIGAPALLVLLALSGGGAAAQDAAKPDAGICESFDWPLTREGAWFAAPDLPALISGSDLPADPPAALLQLKPSAEAVLPRTPSREPKPGSFAGYVRVPAPAPQGEIQVTLSGEGWIDVVQDDVVLKPGAHSGRKGCPSLRKSVRFAVEAKPIVVVVSNATAATIRIAVTPVSK